MALAGATAVLAMGLLVVVALASIGYAVSTVYLLSYLQTHHPQVYERLGSADVYVGKWYDWIQVMPFIWRRNYLAISDSEVARWGAWARTSLLLSAGAFALFLTLFAAFGE